MTAKILEAPEVFASNAIADNRLTLSVIAWSKKRAVYTIAYGSSDAVANILSYLFMCRIYILMMSLPPLIFSIYKVIQMNDAAGLVFSQSGASYDLVAFTKGIRKTNRKVIALTNQPESPEEDVAHLTLPINAGVERAVLATKSVIGSIAAGMWLLTAFAPTYRDYAENA